MQPEHLWCPKQNPQKRNFDKVNFFEKMGFVIDFNFVKRMMQNPLEPHSLALSLCLYSLCLSVSLPLSISLSLSVCLSVCLCLSYTHTHSLSLTRCSDLYSALSLSRDVSDLYSALSHTKIQILRVDTARQTSRKNL